MRSDRHEIPSELFFAVDTNLADPIYVGAGLAFLIKGWCYTQRSTTRALEILLDGVSYPVTAHSQVRLDVFQNHCPSIDQSGNSLLSGFYALLPLKPISELRRVPLGLRVEHHDGSVMQQTIAFLDLRPGYPASPVPVQWANAENRVAICMTTYNPPRDLFVRQIESIRAQTHPNWHCIISDDASSDASLTFIRETIAVEPRFTLLENDQRLGFYHNFERCLQHAPADADFIALSDQDDFWYPDKLAALAAGFQNDTQLVYSDMRIVSESGEILSDTFWSGRQNNATDLAIMMFANTVTGAASMFRPSLLPDLLPFPEPTVEFYHDHWLALTALLRGNIQYLNRPLYDYYQHGSNIVGHRQRNRMPGMLGAVKVLAVAAPRREKLQKTARALLGEAVYNYAYLLQRSVLAQTLLLRYPDASRQERNILSRLAPFAFALPPVLAETIRAALSRRPTFAIEDFHLRSALGTRLWNLYFRSQKQVLLQRQLQRSHMTTSAPSESSSASLNLPLVPANRYGNMDWVARRLLPLDLDISDAYPCRVNLLMGMIDFRYVYGGYIGMFNLAMCLKRQGYPTRIILIEESEYNLVEWRRQIRRYPGLENLFDEIEVLYRYDRDLPLEVNPQDAFIATSGWAAHVATQAMRDLKRERFTFMVQDYEPMFLPSSSLYALFMQAYSFPQYNLFSTELLREYFRINRIGVYLNSETEGDALSVSFQNAINKFPLTLDAMKRDKKRLLFYARPEPHAARNMFELGMMSLVELIKDGQFDTSQWSFHGIGSIDLKLRLELAKNIELQLTPRTSLQEYIALLPTFDVGLSLMLTPHPSLVPLEMASAGLWTVTNSFANKTAEKLEVISTNLIVAPPTIDGIKTALLQGIRRVDQYDDRLVGANVKWATDWDSAFNRQVMAKLKSFLD